MSDNAPLGARSKPWREIHHKGAYDKLTWYQKALLWEPMFRTVRPEDRKKPAPARGFPCYEIHDTK